VTSGERGEFDDDDPGPEQGPWFDIIDRGPDDDPDFSHEDVGPADIHPLETRDAR
jgi:hypothetical protein